MSSPAPSLVLLTLDYPPSLGGIQTLTTEIYSRLADLARVVIAPSAGAPAAPPSGLNVLRSRHPSGQGLRTAVYLRDAARLARPHLGPRVLLHCNHLFAAYAARWLRRRAGVRYLVWVHGEELTKHRYPALARHSLRAAAGILVNSEFTADRVRTLLEAALRPSTRFRLAPMRAFCKLRCPRPTPPPACRASCPWPDSAAATATRASMSPSTPWSCCARAA